MAGAKAAGMNVIMVPDKITSEELRKEADVVAESLLHVDLQKWGLPPLA